MLNKKIRRNVIIENGAVVKMSTIDRNKDAKVRFKENVMKITQNIRMRKATTKEKALSLGTIKVSDLLSGDRTNFMSLAYAGNSEVGLVTARFSVICSLTKEAWTLEDGSIDVELFYRAFTCADKKNVGIAEEYVSVFEDKAKLTDIGLKSYPSMVYDIYYISNIEILAFQERIKGLNPYKITYDDIVKIQADLYHFFRGYQESSIDVTKDKDKAFKIRWDEIIGSVGNIYSKHPENYTDNLEMKMKDRSIKYEILIRTKDDAKQTRNDVLSEAIADTHEEYIENEVLATAEDDITLQLKDVIGTSDDLSTEAKLHMESIISIAGAGFKSEFSDEEYVALRNALYTVVAEEAEDVEKATAMIIDAVAAKYRMTHENKLERNYDITKIRFGTLKRLLGGILPLFINGKSTYTNVFGRNEYCMFQEIEEEQLLTIDNGDIIIDNTLVGCLEPEDGRVITANAAYVVEGNLYVECDIYEDIDSEAFTLVIDSLYKEASTADVVNGKADDNYGKDTYLDLVDTAAKVTGKAHNVLAVNGHIRGRLNAYSANLLESDELTITAENTIAAFVPYDPETDKYEYCCEMVVFI